MDAGEKIIQDEFNRRAATHRSLHAVLDATAQEQVQFENIYRHFISRKLILDNLHPGKNDVILDFGCGVGRLSLPLAEKGAEVKGVDFSEAMIETARDKFHHNAVSYMLLNDSRLPFSESTFSKAFTCWVLQHCQAETVHAIFKEIIYVLSKDGIFIILEQTKAKASETPIHFFRTADWYVKAAEAAGFRILLKKNVIRFPSYAMHLWKKRISAGGAFLSLLAGIEKLTVNRKPQNADYHSTLFIFQKP
jgi:ubiquinone/menaquinone biosynthesis C-methylase UbiE